MSSFASAISSCQPLILKVDSTQHEGFIAAAAEDLSEDHTRRRQSELIFSQPPMTTPHCPPSQASPPLLLHLCYFHSMTVSLFSSNDLRLPSPLHANARLPLVRSCSPCQEAVRLKPPCRLRQQRSRWRHPPTGLVLGESTILGGIAGRFPYFGRESDISLKI